jgi:hypothetical protein
MKIIERRLAAVEAKIPRPEDADAAAVADLLPWALCPELAALENLIERHHRGQPAAGDGDLLEALADRWQARAEDPAIELSRLHEATKRWHRDPNRRLVGHQWLDWLDHFDERDGAGEASAENWAIWWRLLTAIDCHIVRHEPLPAGVNRFDELEL